MWLTVRFDWDTGVSHGVGSKSVPLILVFSDADSGRPIDGAVIYLNALEWQNDPIPPNYLEMKTGPDGKATTVVRLMVCVSCMVYRPIACAATRSDTLSGR